MIKKTLLALALIVVVFLVVVATRPADFRITRSTTIAAPPSAVFTLVNDLHKWEAWSPWAKLDPAMKATYDGPPTGTGASYAWVGNNEVGEGRMTITESHPDDLVRFKLEFLKPMKATHAADLTFKPEGNGTVVTWTMTGTNSFIERAFSLVMNMDKLVGGDFEKGLAQMKGLLETAPKQ